IPPPPSMMLRSIVIFDDDPARIAGKLVRVCNVLREMVALHGLATRTVLFASTDTRSSESDEVGSEQKIAALLSTDRTARPRNTSVPLVPMSKVEGSAGPSLTVAPKPSTTTRLLATEILAV